MKVSGGFRVDLEVQLMNLCDCIQKELGEVQHLFYHLQGARDRLALLSKNDLKPFENVIQPASVLKGRVSEFCKYLESLHNAILHCAYSYEDEQYKIIYEEERKEVK